MFFVNKSGLLNNQYDSSEIKETVDKNKDSVQTMPEGKKRNVFLRPL